MKKFFLLTIALFSALVMNATTTVVLSANADGTGDIEIQPGSTTTAYIYMNSDELFAGYQAKLKLPEGLNIVYSDEDDDWAVYNGSIVPKKMTLTLAQKSSGFQILQYNTSNLTYKQTCGDIIEIHLTADANFSGGNATLSENIFARTNATKVQPSDYTCYISKKKVLATGISLSQANATINIGEHISLSATVLPSDANQNVTWTSSNTSVARVANGMVYGVSKGSAVITATTTDGTNLSATCNVRVLDPNGDTDISQYSNIIYIKNQDVYTGSQVEIPVYLKNTAALTGFQFDLDLPAGMTVAEEDGDYLVDLATDRTSYKKHSISCRPQADGTMRVVCISLNGATFAGNDGVVAYVTVNVPKNMLEGEYFVEVNNMEATTTLGNMYTVDCCRSTLTVVMRGDVNNDNRVSVTDAACTVSIILGTELPSWNKNAADVTDDGSITVADVAGIVNIVLNGGYAAKAEDADYSAPNVALSQEVNNIALAVSSNANEFIAMQFDVRTIADMTEVASALRTQKHIMSMEQIQNGLYRVVIYSAGNNAFAGANGTVANLVFDESAEGSYNVAIENMELVRSDLSTAHPASIMFNANFAAPTGINDIANSTELTTGAYNLNGVSVNENYKGIVVKNGKKFIVK